MGWLVITASLVKSEQSVEVNAWSRATPPGASSGAIYGWFENLTGHDVVAERIEFALAAQVMIHETVLAEGITKMAHGRLAIAAGSNRELKPGATHVMLQGLLSPLVEGCRYGFSVVWQDGHSTTHEFTTGGYGQMTTPDIEGKPCP